METPEIENGKMQASARFNDSIEKLAEWLSGYELQPLAMSHEAALRVMLSVSAGNYVSLSQMAEWMGITPEYLRSHLRSYSHEYFAQLARHYPHRADKYTWQVVDDRMPDSAVRFAYSECVFIIRKMVQGI